MAHDMAYGAHMCFIDNQENVVISSPSRAASGAKMPGRHASALNFFHNIIFLILSERANDTLAPL
jgi:hypothetical protein